MTETRDLKRMAKVRRHERTRDKKTRGERRRVKMKANEKQKDQEKKG